MNDIPRWAFERMEREKSRHWQVEPNPLNVDVLMRNQKGWRGETAFAAFIANHHRKTIDNLKDQLAKPINVEGEPWLRGTGEVFDPWEIFPSLYGSYNSEFDDMAILVLENILCGQFGERVGEGLAHEMFREMLCTANLCDYGMSPRGCFPNPDFKELLPALLEKWREYRRVEWGD